MKVEKWHLPDKKPQSEDVGVHWGQRVKNMATGRQWREKAAKQEVIGTLGRTRDTGQHLREVIFVTILFPRSLTLETYLSCLMAPYDFLYQI